MVLQFPRFWPSIVTGAFLLWAIYDANVWQFFYMSLGVTVVIWLWDNRHFQFPWPSIHFLEFIPIMWRRLRGPPSKADREQAEKELSLALLYIESAITAKNFNLYVIRQMEKPLQQARWLDPNATTKHHTGQVFNHDNIASWFQFITSKAVFEANEPLLYDLRLDDYDRKLARRSLREAEQLAEQSVRYEPNNPVLLNHLAKVYELNGKRFAARRINKRVRAIDPNNVDAFTMRFQL